MLAFYYHIELNPIKKKLKNKPSLLVIKFYLYHVKILVFSYNNM